MKQSELDRIRAKCQARDIQITEQIRAAHRAQCSTWETWTEQNVPVITPRGRERGDVTFDGCRNHNIKLCRV
jgi:hypothetical protein